MRSICIAIGILVLIYDLLMFGLSNQQTDWVIIAASAFWGAVGFILIWFGATRSESIARGASAVRRVTQVLARIACGLCAFIVALYGGLMMFGFIKGVLEAIRLGFMMAAGPMLVLFVMMVVVCAITAVVFLHFAVTGRLWFGGAKRVRATGPGPLDTRPPAG